VDILHQSGSREAELRRLGPYQIEPLISEDQEGCLTAYRVRIEPEQETSESYHKVAEELYYIIEGAGIAVLDGEEFPLETGDLLRLPPGTRHRFLTRESALVMLDIHSPGSRPDRDVYFTGETPTGFSAPE